jgi:hypothetical protein
MCSLCTLRFLGTPAKGQTGRGTWEKQKKNKKQNRFLSIYRSFFKVISLTNRRSFMRFSCEIRRWVPFSYQKTPKMRKKTPPQTGTSTPSASPT